MKECTRKWLGERATFGTSTRSKEILEYISFLESEVERLKEFSPYPEDHKDAMLVENSVNDRLFNNRR